MRADLSSDIESMRDDAINAVETAVDKARAPYRTQTKSQAQIYTKKQEEAAKILDDKGGLLGLTASLLNTVASALTASNYRKLQAESPYLAAESKARVMSVKSLAQQVLDRAAAVDNAMAEIEAIRVPARQSIKNASNKRAIRAAQSSAVTALQPYIEGTA